MKMLISILTICASCFGALAGEYYAVGVSAAFDLNGRGDVALPSGAVMHPGGALSASETWAAGSVHVVYGMVVVPSNTVLTVASGATVKFMAGGIIAEGTCIANGATFTDIADGSGLAMPSYTLRGNFETDDATRIKYVKNGDEFEAEGVSAAFDLNGRGDVALPSGAVVHAGGALSASETWAAGSVHVVYGMVVVPSNTVLTVESGATVKFVAGGIIAEGTCIANGATFTDIADGSGLAMPSYTLCGNLETDDATRIKYVKNGDEFAQTGDSGAFRLDIADDGYRFAHEKEEIAYSSSWGDGDGARVAVTSPQGDTVALVDEPGTASGVVQWIAPASPGLYRFTHSSGGETLEAGFVVLDGAVVHGGTLEADETWTKDVVHIIGGNVYVPAGVVLTIESGAVVKFADGKILSMSGGGVCVAESVVFTSIADDSAGGDTLADGGATTPRENSYMILGMVADDAKTEYRYGTVALCGAIGMDTVWRKEKTYVIDGTLTVASGTTLTIPAGTVVKFTNGSSLALDDGGECIAKGAIFTHIADDAVGGDTMGDGDATAPEYGKYTVDAKVSEDDATEYRYYVPATLSSSISTDTILRGNRVYVASNDVTVASGATLTIGYGSTIKFAAGKSLRLRNGSRLIVQGTRSRPIVFTSLKDDAHGGDSNCDGDSSIPYPGDWGGVIANGGRIEASYAQFLYGGGVNGNSYGARASCFMWDNASGTFSGCRFSGSPMDGCFAQNATFANCIFDDNDRGLVSHTGTITADNCVAANNRIGFFSHTSPLVVRNCISSLNTGSAITGDGGSREISSCYFGDDPKFLNPENGDYRIAAGSPCVDAGDAAYAPEKDYYGSPRYAMTYGGEAKPDIGIHEVLPKRVASDVDLVAEEVSVSGDSFSVGDSITVKWKVRNVGTATAQGPWTDTISVIDASGAVFALGSRTTQRNLAPGATVDCEGTFRIPAVAEGGARIRLVVNSGRDVFEGTLTGNNTASSATSFNVAIPVLDAGEMMTVQVPAGSSVAFRLQPDSKAKSLLFMYSGAISIFGSSSGVPKRGTEEVKATALSAHGADFLVLPVPDGAAEKGFIFAIENSGMSSESVFGGEQTVAMEVYEVYPTRLAVGERTTLRLRGVGMGDIDRAILEGTKRQYGNVAQIVSPTEVLLTFNLPNAEPGTYDLYVEGTNHTFHTYKNAVEIYRPLEGPKLEARIEGPSAVRVGRIISARIVYSNVGDMPMRAPYFMLSSDNSKFRLDGEEEWQEGYVEVMGLGPGADPGVLAPGETGSVAYEFISLGGARTRLESDADTSDYWANHADAAAAAASRLNRRGRRIVRYSELERYAEEFREHPGTSNAACGVLRDHASGEPLAGVEVCAMSEGGELLSFDTVDANGVFVLEGLPSATNLVLSVVEGAFADDLSVAMPVSGDLLGLKWYGTKGWTINVSVEGATAEDFEQGVEIELLRIGDENANAHLTLTNAVENIAAAAVKEAGVYVVRGKTKSGREQFALVECEAGATVAETVIDFSQGHSVSGVVSDTDGSGLSGVLLSLSPKGEMNGYARTVTSGADGAFSFGCMEDGEYLLSWTKNGYGSDVAMDVVVSGGDVKGLSPQCMAFGQSITGKANTECAGMIAAFATPAGGSITATIAEDGTFMLEGLPAGRGAFSVMDGSGNIIYMMRDLYVRPGANTLDVTAETEFCNVIGAAVDANGNPVQAVWLFSSTSGDGGTGYANENGKCLVKLRKATYDVSVAAEGFVTRTFRRKIADSCKLTATLERGGCAKVAADADACLVSFSADGIAGDGVEAQDDGTVSDTYTNGTEVTAFVVCLDKAYRTDSIAIAASATGTLSRVEGGRALTVSATGGKAVVAAFRFALMDGSGFVATWPVEDGKLELAEFPQIAVKVSAIAPDGSVVASADVSADAATAAVATSATIPIAGRIVDEMPAMLSGGAVSFGKGDGTILATAEITPFGTFRADYVSAGYERVWVHLPNGLVFSVSRAEAEATNFVITPPDLDEMGLSQLEVVDENGEPVEGAEVDIETADGYETTLTTDRRGLVWIVTWVNHEPPEYKPPRLPEDPPKNPPEVKPENPTPDPTQEPETKKQMERGPEFACTKCGAFPCVCKVEPPTPPDDPPPEPPEDIKNICPTCGQILPCSCKDKGKETEEKKNNTNEKKPIEEEPVTLPELEDLSDSDIPDLGLSDNWDFWMHWYDNCNKELTDLRKRADAVTMAPNPNYASCQSRNCNNNELLLRRFKALKAEAISAEKDAGALLELIRKEHKLLVGDAAVDVASLACDIIAARLKDKKAAAGVAFLSLGLNVGAMLNTHFRDEIMACFNAVSNVTGGPSYAHDDIIGKILGDSDFSSSSASADSLWASFASALTAGNLVELIENAENHRTTVVSFMTRYFFEENGYVLKEGKWVLDYNYLTKARKQAVAAADKWLNNQVRLFNADNLKLTKTIRAMALVAALAKVGDYVHRANKLDIMVKKLNEVIKQVQKKVIIAEREAKRPYHKCGCGCSPECPCGGLCDNCQCGGGGGGDNGPHPSPGKPHPPYPKPWPEPTSEDPNEVAGPLGIGEHRCVKAGDEMLYTVYFENKSDASAAAQDIYITNPLSEWLDWTTFEMLDIGFNNQIDRGLDGLQSGVSEMALKDTPYFVKSSVALDESSGRVRVELHIVDKTTKYGVPEDPYAGILPPNDSTHRGEGHLTYRIRVREDAPAGVVITNSATIVFDYNDPIETDPAWWNTVAPEGGRFVATEVATDEGGTASVRVYGGSAGAASSVKVYLTYNTAATADLDLKAAAIDGVTPKGGLKFPLTLNWAADEIGEKTITIPIKADKTVEDDEFFTLQLAEAEGMEVGEAGVCTVTIRDMNDKALKAAVTAYKPKKGETVATNSVAVAGTAGGFVAGTGAYTSGSKLTLTAEARPGWTFAGWTHKNGDGSILSTKAKWQIAVTNDAEYAAVFEKIPYVRGLADPADGGKVSGSGYCASGKKVTLKATANKNFAFLGWAAVDSGRESSTAIEYIATTPSLVIDRTAKPAANSKTSTTITEVDGDATYYAVFKGHPAVSVSVEATDGTGANPTGKGAGRYIAGTIAGEGKYSPGKKATLKATANKGYVFAGWDSQSTAIEGNRLSSSISFAMPSNDVAYVARFVTVDEDKESISLAVAGETLSNAPAGTPAASTNIWAGVYIEWPVAASALSETKIQVSGLPSGLKFTAKPVTARIGAGKNAVTVTNVPANTIYGAPSAASRAGRDGKIVPSAVKFTVTTAGKSSQTYRIDVTVDARPAWAVGTFDGATDAGGLVQSFAVAANGKISGKIVDPAGTWTLNAPSLDSYDAENEAFIATVTGKKGNAAFTNEVTVSAEATGESVRGVAAGDGWTAWQNLWSSEPWKTLAKPFAKAKPLAIEADGAAITLKFASNGTATATGRFVTGVDSRGKDIVYSASCKAALIPESGDGARYRLFVHFPPNAGKFDGYAAEIKLEWDGAAFSAPE